MPTQDPELLKPKVVPEETGPKTWEPSGTGELGGGGGGGGGEGEINWRMGSFPPDPDSDPEDGNGGGGGGGGEGGDDDCCKSAKDDYLALMFKVSSDVKPTWQELIQEDPDWQDFLTMKNQHDQNPEEELLHEPQPIHITGEDHAGMSISEMIDVQIDIFETVIDEEFKQNMLEIFTAIRNESCDVFREMMKMMAKGDGIPDEHHEELVALVPQFAAIYQDWLVCMIDSHEAQGQKFRGEIDIEDEPGYAITSTDTETGLGAFQPDWQSQLKSEDEPMDIAWAILKAQKMWSQWL